MRRIATASLCLVACEQASSPDDAADDGIDSIGGTTEPSDASTTNDAKLDMGATSGPGMGTDCDGLIATIRDFSEVHPDFEAYKGRHASEGLEMDTLALTAGETYAMDIFHAERHTNASNFRIETTIACFVTPVG